MELHIVHYNTKYASLGEALDKADGLAVLGFMFEVSTENNSAYAGLVSSLAEIQASGASTSLTANVGSMIGDTADFYRYQGSLTTPNCAESVTWTVFKNTIPISQQQLAAFRSVLDSNGAAMVNNYRPVQPLAGRTVEASFSPNIKWGYLNNQ
ncbi:hypothetical protein EGW08_008316, partial [Elysia chlorotica]